MKTWNHKSWSWTPRDSSLQWLSGRRCRWSHALEGGSVVPKNGSGRGHHSTLIGCQTSNSCDFTTLFGCGGGFGRGFWFQADCSRLSCEQKPAATNSNTRVTKVLGSWISSAQLFVSRWWNPLPITISVLPITHRLRMDLFSASTEVTEDRQTQLQRGHCSHPLSLVPRAAGHAKLGRKMKHPPPGSMQWEGASPQGFGAWKAAMLAYTCYILLQVVLWNPPTPGFVEPKKTSQINMVVSYGSKPWSSWWTPKQAGKWMFIPFNYDITEHNIIGFKMF